MTFARLRAADWVALVAALALLLATAVDWYSTVTGEEARRIEDLSRGVGQVDRQLREDARLAAEAEERNAWQLSALADRLVLVGMLLTAALAIWAAFFRAAGRRGAGLTPSALAGLAAALAALLVTYRILQEPGPDAATTVEAGAPLGLALLGLIAFACATAVRAEDHGTELRTEPPA